MNDSQFVTLRDRPELEDSAAGWFHEKWGVPKEAYLACMDSYLSGETEHGWYLCLNGDEVVGGLGVIENDFHDRKDLAPNICAVYTEGGHRGRGIAGRLLHMAVGDLRRKGVAPVYLVTDHIGFYERYGWEFLCMAQGEGEPDLTRVYVHRTVDVCGENYRIVRLLGHGKGGYSYLGERGGTQVVLKQIHHEPCDYYTFGDKIEAECHDYQRLREAGIRIPQMLAVDRDEELIVKEYIEGDTVFDLLRDGASAEPYLPQVREMAAQARAAGLNIDYFPTNFVVRDGQLWYVDYECNNYMDEWSFERWGVRYWSRTPEFEEYLS